MIENKIDFRKEKDLILATGLEIASYVNVDDTGARHKGKNAVFTHIGNEQFSWFESTASKSRINFLKLLQILNGSDLYRAFVNAKGAMWSLSRGEQTANLDDNRNGIGNEKAG